MPAAHALPCRGISQVCQTIVRSAEPSSPRQCLSSKKRLSLTFRQNQSVLLQPLKLLKPSRSPSLYLNPRRQ